MKPRFIVFVRNDLTFILPKMVDVYLDRKSTKISQIPAIDFINKYHPVIK